MIVIVIATMLQFIWSKAILNGAIIRLFETYLSIRFFRNPGG